jgi:lambda family phage tail tape measure protein
MTNALTNFATTGKLSFKSLVASILSDLAKMEMRIAASKILQSIIGMMAGPSTGSQYTAAGGNGAGDGGYGMMLGTYAKGGAFDATGQITAFASGGIVDGATGFNFAGGAGVMGEAGPEAIMPLSRGSDGRLGVKSAGGGGNVININTSITVDKTGTQSNTSADSSDAMAKQLAGMMESKAKEVVVRATQPGGILWQQ